MNYDIFDEKYYLSQYPWLKPAIDAGIIKSGKEHFEKFGQAAGLTKISRYFDEDTYLAQNQDIASLVRTASNKSLPFASGLDHFIQFGYEEGRTRVSPDYDETFYLKRHPEITRFVQNATFKSGFQHFIKFGKTEGRYGTSFLEPRYLLDNPDVAAVVEAGNLKTGREHYLKFGQFEKNRSAIFTGTNGNDIVTGFQTGTNQIVGMQVALATTQTSYNKNKYDALTFNESNRNFFMSTNEFDTLIGTAGTDYFVLGDVYPNNRPSLIAWMSFYTGSGEARIVNFEKGKDYIQLAESFTQISLLPSGPDLLIQKSGDTLARIQGGANLTLEQASTRSTPFLSPGIPITLLI
ncbi:MAG: calcium-binding protein [Microcoleus sp. PH2017_10_PVI_O_A]|uniref:calcium-binding protein n=1 Tax=unclassified Microcoleus TaxID=2642155 RepID=UPI001DDFD5AF|nr:MULTISPECIES: calcium-binding protein [unclassified Microcoleus]TAE73313.1 MAG: calcium-binding protein [Oscillatoriales cyanobacterium]MCC3409970.1 calcium-binding protein [Microcoleus sp. PH2017_10_PVI_O_A]MCC3464235.1 calcium-binding protein [Microcoleus sp. PH2017_11_PCY_U_A]MCC3482576.1 calcium-binding protein [Microcoleus sp. PH2017_12_PCY_D_A]MCC3532391.1 calcium-binding protein [Microcoleus sp. PH2017_21_RUC_O_A]